METTYPLRDHAVSGVVHREPAAEERRSKILRFRKSERLMHWAIAIPFLSCFSTALILVFLYNPFPDRPHRELFSWGHRGSGICLIVFPLLVALRSRGDFRVHFYNIRQAWIWTLSDLKWLLLMGLASVFRRVKLPEQGKFNAAEKINFMMLMGTYPLYILTGLIIWFTDVAFTAWVVHFGMALLATPLLLGHLYMAVLNPGTRSGLQGMISGFVDRQWAKHHYQRWYREQLAMGVPTGDSRVTESCSKDESIAAQRVSAFLHSLHKHSSEAWTLETMAAACGLGRARFSEMVAELTGDSPITILNRLRVWKARQLLTGTALPITSIALDCGFQSRKHFAKVFKEFTGQKARSYR